MPTAMLFRFSGKNKDCTGKSCMVLEGSQLAAAATVDRAGSFSGYLLVAVTGTGSLIDVLARRYGSRPEDQPARGRGAALAKFAATGREAKFLEPVCPAGRLALYRQASL
eukprot:3425979-Amphidinium_carterae.1